MITIPEVEKWKKSEVTQYFLSLIEQRKFGEDKEVHRALETNNLNDAAICNAAMAAFEEVPELIQIMIENVKEEEDEA